MMPLLMFAFHHNIIANAGGWSVLVNAFFLSMFLKIEQIPSGEVLY